MDTQALNRVCKKVGETLNGAALYPEMMAKNQNDCTKRLVCVLAARGIAGHLVGMEAELSQSFELGNSKDVSSSKAVFDRPYRQTEGGDLV